MSQNRHRHFLRNRVAAVACATFLIGAAFLIFVDQVPGLLGFETQAHEAKIGGGGVRVTTLEDSTELAVRRLEAATADAPHLNIEITPQSGEIFSAYPLEPIHYAIILGDLAVNSSAHIAIAQPLAWPEQDPVSLAALEDALGEIERSTLGVDLTRAIRAETLPASLFASSQPAHDDLPPGLAKVNALTFPTAHHGSSRTLLGFTSLGSAAAPGELPALARYGDRIVFSFPIIYLAQSFGLGVEDIDVSQNELKVGDLAIIKLTPLGQPTSTSSIRPDTAPLPRMSAADLVAPVADSPALPSGIRSFLITDQTRDDASQVAALFPRALVATVPVYVPLVPLRNGLLSLALLAILLAFTQLVPRPLSFLALALVAFIGLGGWYFCTRYTGTWFPLSAIGSSLLVALFFPSPLQKESAVSSSQSDLVKDLLAEEDEKNPAAGTAGKAAKKYPRRPAKKKRAKHRKKK